MATTDLPCSGCKKVTRVEYNSGSTDKEIKCASCNKVVGSVKIFNTQADVRAMKIYIK